MFHVKHRSAALALTGSSCLHRIRFTMTADAITDGVRRVAAGPSAQLGRAAKSASRIDGEPHYATDTRGVGFRVKPSQSTGPGAPREGIVPEFIDALAKRGDGTKSGDHDAAAILNWRHARSPCHIASASIVPSVRERLRSRL